MGASSYHRRGLGKSPVEVFESLKNADRAEYGMSAYSGDIGQKHTFITVDLPKGVSASKLIDGFERVDWKWNSRIDRTEIDFSNVPSSVRPIVQRFYDTYNSKWADAAICIPATPAETREFKKLAGRTDHVRLFHFVGTAAE